MSENSIPEIWETEEDKNRPFKDLREFYIRYAKTHFQGKKYRNTALDEEILVSRDGIDKLEGILGFREQCIAIQLLDQFLINSVVGRRVKDKKNRCTVDEFIWLRHPCKINDKLYNVDTIVKKIAGNNHPLKFYGYILVDIKTEATRR